jgi:hypothetical protein
MWNNFSCRTSHPHLSDELVSLAVVQIMGGLCKVDDVIWNIPFLYRGLNSILVCGLCSTLPFIPSVDLSTPSCRWGCGTAHEVVQLECITLVSLILLLTFWSWVLVILFYVLCLFWGGEKKFKCFYDLKISWWNCNDFVIIACWRSCSLGCVRLSVLEFCSWFP